MCDTDTEKCEKKSNTVLPTAQTHDDPSIYCSGINKQITEYNTDLCVIPGELELKQENTTALTNDIAKQCENLTVNCEDIQSISLPIAKKTRKKKEKLKSLKMENTPNNSRVHNVNEVESPHTTSAYLSQFQVVSVQDFFTQNISPLYVNTTSRQLENMSQHHHQFQFVQEIQTNYVIRNPTQPVHQQQQLPISAPNTPLLQQPPLHHRFNSLSIPNTPILPLNQNSCRYLQNALYHPLLNQQYSANHQQNSFPTNETLVENENKQTTKRQRSRKKVSAQANTNENNFDPYISLEEVETGLKNKTLISGVIRINPKQFHHSYVSSYDRCEQDILIDGIKNRNKALEGDMVVVQIIQENEKDQNEANNDDRDKQKRGKVVYIKEKIHPRTCIGTLKLMQDRNRQRALFLPRDHRMPRLNIPFTCWPDNFYQDAKKYENILFVAKVTDWFDARFAIGKIVCNIGHSGDMVTETKAILAQTDLDVTPFGPEIRHLFPRLDYKIPKEEIELREDCRSLCLFSIDPSNCRDIDDAVSCKQLANGNYEIGVHISDVAHFLAEDTVLDKKVAEKATTIYMVERAYHMLPDEMCMLCSLFPGVDKLAFSVFWEMSKHAKVISHRFSKTVINSCCQLAYEHAQTILEGKNQETVFPETYNGFGYNDIKKTIQTLGQLSRIMRKNRFEGGALRIDQPKVSFQLNASSGLPDSYRIYDSQESHQLIEEFMLLANMTVAARIHKDHPKLAFLRCHPVPSGYMLQQLAKSLLPMGINLEISSAGDLHRSLLPYVGPENDNKGRAMVLSMLCAKPMTRAKYFCADGCDDDDFHHYALNVPLYTHFTSPIRRYADIMVHRLLAASLNYRETPKWEVDKVKMVAAQCNKQKYCAKKAGELSTELYTLKYIEMHSPLITEAVVVEVREKYIDVIIVAMGLNRRIFFNNDFPGKFMCIKNDAGLKLTKMQLTWSATDKLPEVRQEFEVFSILLVEMYKGDEIAKLETKLVRPAAC